MKQVAHQAKLPQERRIYFTKDTAFASYGFACARIKGEFYPVKPDIMKLTYDEVIE